MEDAPSPRWQELHRRALSGETLNTDEQSAYEEESRTLDAGETFDGDLIRLRDLRGQIALAELERQRLRWQEQALDEQIADLEAHLDERTRRQLGIAV